MEDEFTSSNSLAIYMSVGVVIFSVVAGLWHWYNREEDRDEYEEKTKAKK